MNKSVLNSARLICLVALISLTTACGTEERVAEIRPVLEPDDRSSATDRYGLTSPSQKLVDNRGDGYESLYGVRNLRSVLMNTLYRGGANNKYNRDGNRDNRNPLPTVGLENLCREGFDTAVYLYSDNFSMAPKKIDCVNRRSGLTNTLIYTQISPYNEASVRKILSIVYSAVTDPTKGAAYVHCWNGWHASGLISAYALRQFCGWSGEDAVRYWDQNTDGNNRDPAFASLRKRIRSFVPYADFKLSSAEKSSLCHKLR